jgi:amidase
MGKWFNKWMLLATALLLAGGLYAVPTEATANTTNPVVEQVLSVEIEEATIFELQHELQRGSLTSEELVQFYLDRMEE